MVHIKESLEKKKKNVSRGCNVSVVSLFLNVGFTAKQTF